MKLPCSLDDQQRNGVPGHFKNGNGHSSSTPEFCLLNPGPVLTSPRVRQAMARGDLCHRDIAFSELLTRLYTGLKRVADAPRHEVLLLSGGGTAATEAAFSTFLSPQEKILVVSNGAFGERLAEIATVLGLPCRHLCYTWGEPVSVDEIERLLQEDPEIRTVAMVHHETSVGRLNPVKEVGERISRYKVRFFVDVISSLGAEELSAEEAGVAVLVGSANKCLHGVPGVSFLLVREDVWEDAARVPPRSVYLDLRRYRAAALELRQTPFTPAVHALVALDEALRELEAEGGPQARRAHYLTLQSRIRQGLRELGISLHFDGPGTSSSLTVADLPTDASFAQLYEALRRRGFIIYEAKGPLKKNCFIVANMGHLDLYQIEAFLAALRDVRSQAQRLNLALP